MDGIEDLEVFLWRKKENRQITTKIDVHFAHVKTTSELLETIFSPYFLAIRVSKPQQQLQFYRVAVHVNKTQC